MAYGNEAVFDAASSGESAAAVERRRADRSSLPRRQKASDSNVSVWYIS